MDYKSYLIVSFYYLKLMPLKTGEEKRLACQFFGLPEDAIVVGTVGNRNRQKSHDQFVRIAKQVLAQTDKAVYFVIVGAITPSYQPTYSALVEHYLLEENLTHRVKLFESTIAVETILCGFDVFLLTSMAEGVPTVLLEAMSVGMAITHRISNKKLKPCHKTAWQGFSFLFVWYYLINSIKRD